MHDCSSDWIVGQTNFTRMEKGPPKTVQEHEDKLILVSEDDKFDCCKNSDGKLVNTNAEDELKLYTSDAKSIPEPYIDGKRDFKNFD